MEVQVNLPDSKQMQEILRCQKERDDALLKLAAKETELRQLWSKYNNLVKHMEKPEKTTKCACLRSQLHTTADVRPLEALAFATNTIKRHMSREDKASKRPCGRTPVPVIPGMESVTTDPVKFYQIVSERFPNAKLSLVTSTIKEFLAIDKNGDGIVDIDELELFFAETFPQLTKKQVQGFLDSADLDDSGTLDFMEVLQVMHTLEEHRGMNLSDYVKSVNKPHCTIQ